MQQLSSGTRISPPWPIATFNQLGGLARLLGVFPRFGVPGLLDGIERGASRSVNLDPWFAESRRRLFSSFDQDAGLSLFGALAMRNEVRQCYRNMIDFETLLDANPEIKNEKIARPLFVLGFARTGTTLVQRLLSLHEDARYLAVWEGYIPYYGDEACYSSAKANECIKKAKRALALLDWLAPDMKIIHPMSVEDPDECYLLFRNYFSMPPGFDFAYVPGYWSWLESQPATYAYEAHKLQLQILQWQNRRGHWVLKSPQHLAGLPALLQVYPDAQLVMTHRDPVEAVASYCSLIAVMWSVTAEKVDLQRVADYVISNAVRAKRIADATLASLPDDRVCHIDYRDLTANPVATVANVYERFGYPQDVQLTTRMRAWMDAHPNGDKFRHKYRLSDFGLTEDEVRKALA